MSLGEMINAINQSDEEKNVSMQLTFHCAPILKGSKAANIMTIDILSYPVVSKILADTRISHLLLKTNDKKAILYLYRREALEQRLEDKKIRDFLQKNGYPGSFSLCGDLKKLSERIRLFGSGEAEFPHEIGVFLDYPLEDVLGFIDNNGKNYLYSGYWKVYHDVRGAQKLFKIYDRQRNIAMTELLKGKSLKDIAV